MIAPESAIDRRRALRRMAGGLMAPLAMLHACGGERSARLGGGAGSLRLDGLAPARVTVDRIIKTHVGLRPYRATGFRLEAERVSDTLVIHNYGHGGGGVTLSWGTASIALDLLRDAGQSDIRRVAVLGAGVIGLSTAILLLRRGFEVTVYAANLPPDTTSNLSAANFYPSWVVDDAHFDAAFRVRLESACRISHRTFTDLAPQPRYGVRWRRSYFLTDEWNEELAEGGPIYAMLGDLFPNPELFGPGEHPFPTRYVSAEDNLFMEPPLYMEALLEDVRRAGGRVERRLIHDMGEVTALGAPVVFNCTGLGAMGITGDRDMTPIPGQLVFLEPQPEVDYAVIGEDGAYLFPRSDGLALGLGTRIRTPEEVIERHRALVPLS